RAATAMQFVRFKAGEPLQRSRLGVLQPAPGAGAIALHRLDIVALPLVGFDGLGNRLGMGGGFYDRALQARGRRPLLVGLAHAGQQLARLPVEPWDVPLDWIATDRRLLRCPPVRRLMG
ncbi:MAG TPA: 5-formyltetrahydrofolate cyclo-ligase, partial [Cellvibrionaceae bacterium]|nr:5-formyltetrahydrofolate cyclo-ligase [Cellvibrionaceae bacterium]